MMTATLPAPPKTKTPTAIRRFLSKLHLESGPHSKPETGMCLLEAVAFMQGQPFSDHPACVSPAIGAFGRSWNDGLDDEGRQRLKRFIPLMVGTATTPADETTRAYLAADWLVRTFLPLWLDKAGLDGQAARLRGLEELTSDEMARVALPVIKEVRALARKKREDAYKAAGAAGAAEAAWAAWAAWAAEAAWVWKSTPGDYYAKRAAVRAAAREWGRKHFAVTISETRASAEELLLRMCAVGR